jgi:hypothetical protein
MNDDYLNEADPLERILRGMTNADDLKELTLHMSTQAIDCYARVCSGLTSEELQAGITNGTIATKVKQLVDDEFEVTMRRWLAAHGYL